MCLKFWEARRSQHRWGVYVDLEPGYVAPRKGKERAFSSVAQGCCWVSQVGAAFTSEPGLGGSQCKNEGVSKRLVEMGGNRGKGSILRLERGVRGFTAGGC